MGNRNLLAIIIALLCAVPGAGQLMIYEVDTTIDNNGFRGCTAVSIDCSLRGAITNANTDGILSQIILGDGIYQLTIIGSNQGGNQGPPLLRWGVPSAGPAPMQVAQWKIWSFHFAKIPGTGDRGLEDASVTITRKSNGQVLPVEVVFYSFPDNDTLGITRGDWQVVLGETYAVHVSNTSRGDVTYEVTPITCP